MKWMARKGSKLTLLHFKPNLAKTPPLNQLAQHLLVIGRQIFVLALETIIHLPERLIINLRFNEANQAGLVKNFWYSR